MTNPQEPPRKKLLLINGTMGVGKTAVCTALYKAIPQSVWLDGDWSWMMNPFVVNDENKQMIEDNLRHLLQNFFRNSSLHTIIFNWVLHTDEMFEMVLSWLTDFHYDVFKITLTCTPDALQKRLQKDLADATRNDPGVIERSLARLALYEAMDTIKVDTTTLTIGETVDQILNYVR